MRLVFAAIFGVLLALVAGEIASPGSSPQDASIDKSTVPLAVSQAEPNLRLYHRAVDVEAEWEKAWCKGAKLSQVMIKDEAQAVTYVTPLCSRWDGPLTTEFERWGYSEMSYGRDFLCDFGRDNHQLETAFKALNMNTRSTADGGPNKCYNIEHQNGTTIICDPGNEWPPVDRQYYDKGGRRLRTSVIRQEMTYFAPVR